MIKYIQFPSWFNYIGITLFPFIFLSKKLKGHDNTVLINHEQIHMQQQKEGLIIIFYVVYIVFFLLNYLRLRNFDQSYRCIPFELEAYYHQKDLEYIKNRKFYAWIKYV